MSQDLRVLITGAGGFVGEGVRLVLAGAGVAFVGTSRTPSDGLVSTGPVNAQTDWSAALSGCNAVVHLAGPAHRRAGEAEHWTVNVEGTLRLAEQAAAAGVSRFVLVSSVKVNGERTSPGHPFTEAGAPSPEDAYGRSKWAAEQGLTRLAAATGLPVIIIRPALVYGPGVGGNLRNLMHAVAGGWPLPFGAVDNRRSLIGRANLADLIHLCLLQPAAVGETFLAADGEDISTVQLTRAVAKGMGRTPWMPSVPAPLLQRTFAMLGRAGFADRLLGNLEVDAGKARRVLGWVPPVRLEQGLAEMVAAYRR